MQLSLRNNSLLVGEKPFLENASAMKTRLAFARLSAGDQKTSKASKNRAKQRDLPGEWKLCDTDADRKSFQVGDFAKGEFNIARILNMFV